MTPIALVALLTPLLPAAVFALLGLTMLVSRAPSERTVARLTSLAFTLSTLAALSLAGWFLTHDDHAISIELGTWFHTEDYGFETSLLVDRLSVPMMVVVSVLCGLIGRFSSTYLVREPGQPRFYLLLTLFATGMLLLVMAGSLDLLIAGWELVGLSSMLLIAFFHDRPFPVRNALRAFIVYRSCDIGLLTGTVLMHHYAGTGDFQHAFGLERWPATMVRFDTVGATLVGLSLLWAASGKSALFPMGSWLPRAMEGPTPSSAIFYGSLSVHAGAYLMLRVSPLLDSAPGARAAITIIGLVTAVHGTLVQRVQTDVKSQLAYATSTQVGVIFAEIGLGLPKLALFHLVAHALLRTLQMLRAPNAILDATLLRAAAGTHRIETGQHLSKIGSTRLSRTLYHLSLERFHLDAFWERAVAHPVMWIAHTLEDLEAKWLALLSRGTAPVPPPAHIAQPREGEQAS